MDCFFCSLLYCFFNCWFTFQCWSFFFLFHWYSLFLYFFPSLLLGNIVGLLKSVGIYCISAFCGIFLHLTITLPLVFFLFTHENPYLWIYSCRKALLVAVSTSSSVYLFIPVFKLLICTLTLSFFQSYL